MKITATNMRKKDGSKLINGYKLTLQKTEVERIGMGEGTELVPRYEDGQIILIEANRLICNYASVEKLWCYTYKKIAQNQYNKEIITYKMPTEIAEEILNVYGAGGILPKFRIKGENLIWKNKEYTRLD